jgi:hypothetical protein
LVIDEWIDKITSDKEDTVIAFQYNAPNTEAPQSLLLAVSPADGYRWIINTIRKEDTIRANNIRSIEISKNPYC